MPITVRCLCGHAHDVPDDEAGATVTCPRCRAPVRVPGVPGQDQEPVLAHDVFLLAQRHLAIDAKYVVASPDGEPLLFVRRPAHLGRNVPATLAGVLAGFVTFGFIRGVGNSLGGPAVEAAFALVGLLAGAVLGVAVYAQLCAKRHVTAFRRDERGPKVFEVLQLERVAFLQSNFTVTSATGRLLATLRVNHLTRLFRTEWNAYGPDGKPIARAIEDALWRALLRRLVGPLLGALRTNYLIEDPRSGTPIGTFERRLTILDRYVLDMRGDPERKLDRRVAVALGVMLDTGERR